MNAPLTASWSEVEDLDAAETILVNGWAHALRHGQTARFVAALIENAVGFDPRLGLPMDVCESHGCSVFVDEQARDEHGRLYCSDGCRDDAAHRQEQTRQGWAA